MRWSAISLPSPSKEPHIPTKRDDAAYKQAYRKADDEMRGWVTPAVLCVLRTHIGRAAIPINDEERFGRIDCLTDILMERGLCASVLDWHKKPAGDELPW